MLLCDYLIPKECGDSKDSKVLFSKLQLATYICSIHYMFPFEFILGYIVRRLVIILKNNKKNLSIFMKISVDYSTLMQAFLHFNIWYGLSKS